MEAFTGESNEEAVAKSKDARHGWRPAQGNHDTGADLRFRGKVKQQQQQQQHLEPATLTTSPVDEWKHASPPFLLPAQDEDGNREEDNLDLAKTEDDDPNVSNFAVGGPCAGGMALGRAPGGGGRSAWRWLKVISVCARDCAGGIATVRS